ncbi:MAG: hypothetical protein HN891_02820 [Planctomycetes bacterium]|nr:hypothetical protein [Planctomycetota bacterium]MBT6453039.1 hypothetical protein [Planctomycetota bacterium]MBT6541933.1 hypothetical protein [Planctomycetota bacterium]MBT6785129.1 hypothetical protein [Planctomycetota bacterium]MBT6968122.1 hypothetical protein [Planctomycetota bacterium]
MAKVRVREILLRRGITIDDVPDDSFQQERRAAHWKLGDWKQDRPGIP